MPNRPQPRYEYDRVIRRAGEQGWLAELIEAHSIRTDTETAAQILCDYDEGDTRLMFRHRQFRGRAGYHKDRGYRISLPSIPGGRSCLLRIGLVLHEMAHLWDHRRKEHFGHGPSFCRELRRAIESPIWRRHMPTSSFKEIYNRHRGPYSLQIVREIDAKGKPAQGTEHLEGPYSAEEAHEESRLMVKSAKEKVVEVFVFSITEGQFIGAFYKRGEAHRPWHELEEPSGRVELPDQRETPALVQGGEEPVRPVDDPILPGVPAEAVPPRGSVRDVPAKAKPAKRTKREPTKLPGDRFPVVRGRNLALGNPEGWPKSAPAQVVREYFKDDRRATAAEVIQAIGGKLKELGMEHPGSLVSRLKQSGLLKEVE